MEGEWSFLREFAWEEQTQPTSWEGAILFCQALDSLEAPLRQRLRLALDRWDQLFSKVGGDPLREDWRSFRPLRRGREEDWSDWLAWLLATSESGGLAGRLFRRDANPSCRPTVKRELSVGQHRLDLQMQWTAGDMSTLEVKIGDQDFEKTLRAAEAHGRTNPATPCEHWILLPPEDLDTWRELQQSEVQSICWGEVAEQLRACLVSDNESITWRVWGRAFLGCIEQDLLGYPQVKDVNDVADVLALLKHLEKNDGE